MRCLARREKLPVHNPYKSDVWSIGLTILEMASLLSIDDCYNWDDCTISYTVIQELLSRVQQKYSYELVKLIKSLLEEDENIRPDFTVLYS